MAKSTVYEFYVELIDISPKMHRTFLVESDMELYLFAKTVQELFEMDGGHLSQILLPVADNEAISQGKKRLRKQVHLVRRREDVRIFKQQGLYGDWAEEENYNSFNFDLFADDTDEFFDEDEDEPEPIVVSDLCSDKNHMMYMEYDFGDCWQLWIVLKKINENQDILKFELPKVLKGVGYGIIEDCGGSYGLYELMNKQGELYEEFFKGTEFDEIDFSNFDVKKKNDDLKQRLYQQ